jgi:hypothetical protein
MLKFQNRSMVQLPSNIVKWMICPKSKNFQISKASANDKIRRLSSQNVQAAPARELIRKSKTLKMDHEP